MLEMNIGDAGTYPEFFQLLFMEAKFTTHFILLSEQPDHFANVYDCFEFLWFI